MASHYSPRQLPARSAPTLTTEAKVAGVGVPPLEAARLRRIFRQPEPIRFEPRRQQPTFGERLVLFMQLNGEALSFWFAMFSIALLVGVVGGAFLAGAK